MRFRGLAPTATAMSALRAFGERSDGGPSSPHPGPLPEEKYSLSSCVMVEERENRFWRPGFIGHESI
jgi:hypothetical protein